MTKTSLVVDFVADPVCPWCYVGLKALLAARDALAGEFDLHLRMRPFLLNPDTPAAGVDRHAYYRAKFPDAEGLAAARAAIRETARASGFDFDPAAPSHLPNTLKAHQLMRVAHFSGLQEQTALALYRAYWDDLKDIGGSEILIGVAGAVGLDKGLAEAALGSSEDAAAVADEARAFREGGVAGVPTFIVGERTGFSGAMPPDRLAAALRRAAAIGDGEAA